MGKKVTCPTCKGKGTVHELNIIGMSTSIEKKCPNCGGTGYVYEKD